ncbi:hypothetical protein BKA56DRAFT_261706 [Ilyonectria sp. MPI-CAGE-AT-0026]|nr:hypothetical protein BKA56DRAFT_261706 [Ilyonectria sp. MPI-CAGE-AT-0026]
MAITTAGAGKRQRGGRKGSPPSRVPADIRPVRQRNRPILPKEGDRERDFGELIPRPEELAGKFVGHFGPLGECRHQDEVRNGPQSCTSGSGVDIASRIGKRTYQARVKRQKRPPRHERLARGPFTFQPIQPKEPAVEDGQWRGPVESGVRVLPKRPRREGRPSKTALERRVMASAGGSGQVLAHTHGRSGDPGRVEGVSSSRQVLQKGAAETVVPSPEWPSQEQPGPALRTQDIGFRPSRPLIRPRGMQGDSGVLIPWPEEIATNIVGHLSLLDEHRRQQQQHEPLDGLRSGASGRGPDVASRVRKRTHQARVRKQKRPPRYERLASTESTFQPIQPKESADAESRAGTTPDVASMPAEVSQPAPIRPGRGSRIHSKHWRNGASRPAALHAPAIGADQGDALSVGRSLLPKGAEELTQSPSRGNAIMPEMEHPESVARNKRQRLRGHRPSKCQPPRKRVRSEARRQRREVGAEQELANVLRWLEDFDEKERLSNSQEWCVPVPQETQTSTVKEFYEAFHDPSTLPMCTCMICYRKSTKYEFKEVKWDEWVSSPVEKRDGSPFSCRRCSPMGSNIPSCAECIRHLKRGSLSPAAQLHCRLGCEHLFPHGLMGLTPIEEKLIALNSCYGFITRYSLPDGKRQSVKYPRHVKGHTTVFPNNVQELATKV